MKEGVTVINTMADGSICEDLSTYLKSADQLPAITIRLMRMFMENGYRILEQEKKEKAEKGENGG